MVNETGPTGPSGNSGSPGGRPRPQPRQRNPQETSDASKSSQPETPPATGGQESGRPRPGQVNDDKASRTGETPRDASGGANERPSGASSGSANETPPRNTSRPSDGTNAGARDASRSPAQGSNARPSGSGNSAPSGNRGNAAANPQDATSGNKAAPVSGAGDKASAAKQAAKDKVNPKNLGANATDVDYSDKGMKDRLEHQAADLAMDATPGLSQFNQARKQVKKANQAQRKAGVDNKATEKAEQVMDKGVDTGIKGTKLAAGGLVGGAGTAGGLAVMAAMKMMMMLKSFVMGLGAKTIGLLSSIISGVGNFISGVLGVGAAAGKILAGGLMSVVLTGATMAGGALMDVIGPKDVGSMCIPTNKKVDEKTQEYVAIPGEARVAQEANAKKLWSVYSRLGGSKAQTAAVLGNLHHESNGLDPTATETIFDEPFQMGPRKQQATKVGFDVMQIDAAYGTKYPAIDKIGVGLAQWTNGRNELLMAFSKKTNSNWFDFDTQVRFMLAGDDPLRQDQLKNFLSGGGGNVSGETERFMNTWIGLSSPNASIGDRQMAATDYVFILERAEADDSYADSILSGLNVDQSQGNTAQDAYFEDDGCGNTISTHYASGGAADGTGEVPAGIELVPWTRETLPEGLRKFMKDPEKAGLAWGNASGWASGIYADQCVAFTSSYFMRIFPDWNQGGRGTNRPTGNGIITASGWAAHYGESTSKTPAAGAAFSLAAPSPTGHTGLVQHVFANGDIFVAEQNIPGISGELAGMSYSWGFRVIPKAVYESQNFEFFKPKSATPNWGTTGKA